MPTIMGAVEGAMDGGAMFLKSHGVGTVVVSLNWPGMQIDPGMILSPMKK
jgi:hypothetical protein